MLFSCTKKEEESTQFTLKVSAFSTQVATFKGLGDDQFNTFNHVYPINSNITFTNIDGKKYLFTTGNLTLETFKFGLPVGTYKMIGSGGSNAEGSKDMSFTIPEQTITITLNTTSIPITVNPTCFLILIADPSLLIDTTNPPRIYNYGGGNSGGLIYTLININTSLRY